MGPYPPPSFTSNSAITPARAPVERRDGKGEGWAGGCVSTCPTPGILGERPPWEQQLWLQPNWVIS